MPVIQAARETSQYVLGKIFHRRESNAISEPGSPLLMPLLARILAIGSCGVVGYFAASLSDPPSTPPPAALPAVSSPPLSTSPPQSIPPSATPLMLVAEWDQLRGQHPGAQDDYVALHSSIKEMKDGLRRTAFRSALIAEWAIADPLGALAFLQKNDAGSVSQLLREWLRADPQAAITHLLTSDEKTRGKLRELLGEIVRVAPARAAEVVAALPKSENRWDTSARDAFERLAQQDPEAAREAALAVQGPMRTQALAGVAREWAQRDGPAALAWAQSLPEGEERDSTLKGVLTGWAKTDPIAALNKLDLVPPGGEEMYYASDVGAQVLQEAAKRDWQKTVAWLKENPNKLGYSSMSGLQNVFTQKLAADPIGMMQNMADNAIPALSMVFGNAVLNDGYAKRDAIWEWLDGQPDSDFTRGVRSSLLNAIAYKEPMVALEFLDKLPEGPESKELLNRGAQSMLNGGQQMHRFEEFLAKASPKLRPYLIEAGFQFGFEYIDSQRNAMIDPAPWTSRINELPPERREYAVMGLARSWAQNDPLAALKWAQSLQEPAHRTGALGAAVSKWAETDPYETAEWINSLPKGGERDIATTGLVLSLSQSEPESAWSWALSIESGDKRTMALQHAYTALQQKDPAIAQQLLSGAELTATERQMLQRTRTQ